MTRGRVWRARSSLVDFSDLPLLEENETDNGLPIEALTETVPAQGPQARTGE
jgi:hypothetical protein